MKFQCPRKEFFEAVSAANAASSARTPVSILQHLKIKASSSGITITGCDGEMWVVRDVACLVEDPGELCLPAKTLTQIVSQLPDGDLELFTLPDHGAMLVQSKSEYRLPTLEAEDFPDVPVFMGEAELKLPLGELRQAVDSVAYAVSTDNHRQVLTGVLFSYNGDILTLVATDTHRLAVRRISKPGIGSQVTAIVPDKALRAIKNLPLADDIEITLSFDSVRVGVESTGATVVSQLLAGTYPNWERVVPSEFTRTWSVESDQLYEKVRRAMILAQDNANRVRFKGDGDQIVIAARSEEKGEAKEEIPMIPSNGDLEIAFNGKYVTDFLGAVDGPGVRVEMTESSRPAVFRPAEDDSEYFCVIMPMALA
jgi:DNA polymerase-3 subunit beta